MSLNQIRLDTALVELGIFETEEQGRRTLLAGELEINGDRNIKPGKTVSIKKTDDGKKELFSGKTKLVVCIRQKMPFVSRGGLKLQAAIEKFEILPKGMMALDIGSSTGGFSDCLLQRGAKKIYCVDCGRGQLHSKIRDDKRVVTLEKTNARFLTKEQIPETPDIVVIDVSFISLELILPVVDKLGASGTIVIALVKPQFEVSKDKISKGGVVKNVKDRKDVVEKIKRFMFGLSWTVIGEIESPITGPAGNHEFLLVAKILKRT